MIDALTAKTTGLIPLSHAHPTISFTMADLKQTMSLRSQQLTSQWDRKAE